MNLFSIVLIGITTCNLLIGKNVRKIVFRQTLLTLFVCLNINVGYFVNSDLINVDYYQAAIILQLIISMIVVSKTGISFKNVGAKRLLLYFCSLTISVTLLALFPAKDASVTGAGGYFEMFMVGKSNYFSPEFNKLSIFYLFLAAILAINFTVIYNTFRDEDWKYLIHKFTRLSRIILLVVIFEFIIKNIFKSNLYFSIIRFVFGQGTSTYQSLVRRGSIQMLQGLTREGSHLAYGLTIFIVATIIDIYLRKNRNEIIWIAVAGIELLLTGAFTAVWSIIILYVLLYFAAGYNNRIKTGQKISYKKILLIFSTFVFFVLLAFGISLIGNNYTVIRANEFIEVLKMVGQYSIDYFNGNYRISSSQTRVFSIIITFNEFIKHRPLFGLGLGTTYCYSDCVLTLAETGIMGFLSYSRFYFNHKRDKCKRKPYLICASIWLVYNIFIIYHTRMNVAVDVIIICACLKSAFSENSNLVLTNAQKKG